MATGYVYKNKNTGDTYTFDQPAPDLEALPNWERQDVEVPQYAVDAAARARAQQESIEEAARNRYDRTLAASSGDVNLSGARNSSLETGVPVPTLANTQALGEPDQTGLLSGDDARGRAVQIGPDQHVHPRTFEELVARQQADIENPPQTGVLGRAHRDHRTGATQIGENPEIHQATSPQVASASSDPDQEAADAAGSSDAVVQAEESGANRADVVPEPVSKEDAGAGPAADTGDSGGDAGAGGDTGDTGTEGGAAEGQPEPPKASARKSEWVTYAVQTGGLTQAEAEALTVDELRERFGK